MTKYWLGDKNFFQQKLFPDEISPDKVYLTFIKVLHKFDPLAKRPLPPPFPLPLVLIVFQWWFYRTVSWNFLTYWLNSSISVLRSLVFQIVGRFHQWSLYLRMLGKGLQLKTTALLVFFLWLVKSLKNL